MNNWLGFSLSPQEQLPSSQTDHHHHQDHSQNSASHRLGFNSDELSGTVVSGDCFDLTSADSTPPSFGILEAFHRNHNHSQGLHTHFFQNPNPSHFLPKSENKPKKKNLRIKSSSSKYFFFIDINIFTLFCF